MNESDALRACAIHEAGHAAAAEALVGGTPRVTIQRRQDGGKVWFDGLCQHLAAQSTHDNRVMALAGAAAEVLLHRDRYARGANLLSAIWQCMSVEDKRNAGTPTQADVEDAVKLVWSHRTKIEARADAEIARFRAPSSAIPAPASRPAGGNGSSSVDDDDDRWLNELLAQQPSLRNTWLFGSKPYPRGLDTSKAAPWLRAIAASRLNP